MKYWTVFGFFQVMETFLDMFVFWIPFYYEVKIGFLIFMIHPKFEVGLSYPVVANYTGS